MWSALQLAAERQKGTERAVQLLWEQQQICANKQPNGVRRLMILLGRGIFLVKWTKLEKGAIDRSPNRGF